MFVKTKRSFGERGSEPGTSSGAALPRVLTGMFLEQEPAIDAVRLTSRSMT